MSEIRYPAPGFGVPRGGQQALPVVPLDDTNGQRITLTGSAQNATALPTGCDMALVTNLGANVAYVAADGSTADNAATPILATAQRDIVVTAANRVISLLGTATDVVVIVPYKPTAG